jgi:hypothetical protein
LDHNHYAELKTEVLVYECFTDAALSCAIVDGKMFKLVYTILVHQCSVVLDIAIVAALL